MDGIKSKLEEFEAKEHSGRCCSPSSMKKAIRDINLLHFVIQSSNGTTLNITEMRLLREFTNLTETYIFSVLEQAITCICNKPNHLQFILNKTDLNKNTEQKRKVLYKLRALCILLRKDMCN